MGKYILLTSLYVACELTFASEKSPTLVATVYTDLLSNSKIMNLAPLAPQVWGEQDFKVPQDWGI